MLFYSDNQILVGADVKLVKNRILAARVITLCILVVSGYQCCRGKNEETLCYCCVYRPLTVRLLGVIRLKTKP
jgi:hypothetical protein